MPPGEHKVKFGVSRTKDEKDQGIIMLVYEYRGVGGRMLTLEQESDGHSAVQVAKTAYTTSSKVEGEVKLVGAPNYYMLLPCLQHQGSSGRFVVSVEVDGGETPCQLFELTSAIAEPVEVHVNTAWTTELSEGYQKFCNPQVQLELPQGLHSVCVKVSRPGGETDQGLVAFVYKVDGQGRVSTGELLAKSGFNKSAEQTLEASLQGYPNRYVVIPCLQTKGITGDVVVSATCGTAIVHMTSLDDNTHVTGSYTNTFLGSDASDEFEGVPCKMCGGSTHQLFFRDDEPNKIMCGRCWLVYSQD